MHKELDPLDRTLESLRSREWKPDDRKTELEEKLMQEFNHKPPSHRFGNHPVLLAALAVLLLGSAAFAATGGVTLVKDWFVKVYIDGQEVDSEVTNVYDDEDGTTHMTLDMGDVGQAELAIVQEGEGEIAEIHVTAGVTQDRDGDGVIEMGFGIGESESDSDDE